MYDAVSIYHVMKAERQAMLAELEDLERRRSHPRGISAWARRPANAAMWIPWLRRSATRPRTARLADSLGASGAVLDTTAGA